MKTRNFPARIAKRQRKTDLEIASARYKRTKKTPRSSWSPAREARHGKRGVDAR